jgi:F-type H+-transporting ATPase subunit gamma
MPRLAELEARVASMDALLGIVGAMRSLAGVRVQEAQRLLPGIRSYAQSMATAIGSTLAFIDEEAAITTRTGKKGRLIILLTAEHGFTGGFNERLLETVLPILSSADALLVLGNRGAAILKERGQRPVWTQAMATQSKGVLDATHRLSGEIYRHLAAAEKGRVEVIFSRYDRLGSWRVERKSLLPLDLSGLRAAPPRQPPLHHLPPSALIERLTGEYVFAQLMEAVMESLASENSARFASMESAHDNITKKLDHLRQETNQQRQEEITMEILDLLIGAEAQTVGV